MSGFLRRRQGLGQELRDARPRPQDALVRSIESRVDASRSRPRRRLLRLAPAAAFTVALAAALAATGGISYAASGVEQAANSISNVLVPPRPQKPVIVRFLSSGHDQYRNGYGWGDPNHIHTGPPGLKKKGPPHTRHKRKYTFVFAKFHIDEQADVWFSIQTGKSKSAKRFAIIQKHSRVGQGVKGRATKSLRYRVLIPRTIRMKLAIPTNMLKHGHRYYIRIRARSPIKRRSQLFIRFKA
jgi:hypothetical protein